MTLERRPVRRLFVPLALLLTLGAMEGLATIGVRIFDARFGLRPIRFPKDDGFYQKTYSKKGIHWDRELGWDEWEPVRRAPSESGPKVPLASSYGDSFTFCAEVPPYQTWQHRFRVATGEVILNLGVSAAGTDQAYLKLLKYHRTYPTRVVLLGLLPENIRRNVGVLSALYLRTPMPLVKPRFDLDQAGRWRLRASPIRSLADVRSLGNPAGLGRIVEHDYWYALYRERFGFDAIQGRSFPYLDDLFTILYSLAKHGPTPVDHYALLREEGVPVKITLEILRQFKARSSELGFSPVIILHVERRDFEHLDDLRPLWRFVEEDLRIPVLNVLDLFDREIRERGASLSQLYLESHYSSRGNDVLARGLIELFVAQGFMSRPKAGGR